ncbi:aldolase/citrate lyase family protein [Chelativorans sp. AA-79]|uniref:HpcH/HpaI aldolase family protein n=1 Tax=Chelativorans sp. AA-79 TaxID=3028735 RepID=UPI0023F67B89|nr:aldolase/citrate lyase family protein [Chelativorans sp. AA-79]WEX08093.1 aldolase/citrate lyase family protein [Chelativorans sp. AA-79]
MAAVQMQEQRQFTARLRAGESLFGTFVKMPTYHATEILASAGYDFIVIDEEHAPINRESIDAIILAARARGVAPLVRIGEPTDFNIMAQLDAGAAGVFVPHVNSVEKASRIAAACRYAGGRRGFSKTGRAGDYGAADTDAHLAHQDVHTLCIPMIEDPEAIDVIDEIVAVEGVAALFVGRGDLSVAMGERSQTAKPVLEATDKVIAAARNAGKPVLMLAAGEEDQAALMRAGVRTFLTGSDQAFLRRAAASALGTCRAVAARSISS